MARIVILGAGPTGLSAAYHLEQQGFFDYILFEKENTIGGLCRSVNHDGFTYDFTGHLLHINDDYFRSFINTITSLDAFKSITRKSYIYSHNVYSKYPFQSNLYGLPNEVIIDCIQGFVERKKTKKTPRSFHAWVLQHFGRGFGTHFFFPYQEKIFSYDIRKISPSWTGRFVPTTTLPAIIEGALQESTQEVGYNAHFYYPRRGGIQFWLDALAGRLIARPRCSYEARTIDLKKRIIFFTNGHQEPFEHLITTIPLDRLLGCVREPAGSSYTSAVNKLRCNAVITINLGIARDDISDKHWIYFPEKKYPFYRIGFYHNFSSELVPPGCSSLYAECSYLPSKKSDQQATIELAKKEIHKLLRISDNEIINETILTMSHAYVIFNQWRDRHINELLASLARQHIHSVGRYGAWKYSSMQEAVLDGRTIAQTLMENYL